MNVKEALWRLQRPSLLLEEKVSPVRTLVTDAVENVANSPEV